MPITYATPELRDLMEQPGSLPGPDRRTLIYLVRCPISDQPCYTELCEYGECESAEPDDGEDAEPAIHISPVPGRYERHAPAPLDYEHQWHQAVAEAALLMDDEHLQELDDHQRQLMEPPVQREAKSELIAAIRAMLYSIAEENAGRCGTCGKPNLGETPEECAGCARLGDHEAPRHEYAGEPATAAA